MRVCGSQPPAGPRASQTSSPGTQSQPAAASQTPRGKPRSRCSRHPGWLTQRCGAGSGRRKAGPAWALQHLPPGSPCAGGTRFGWSRAIALERKGDTQALHARVRLWMWCSWAFGEGRGQQKEEQCFRPATELPGLDAGDGEVLGEDQSSWARTWSLRGDPRQGWLCVLLDVLGHLKSEQNLPAPWEPLPSFLWARPARLP